MFTQKYVEVHCEISIEKNYINSDQNINMDSTEFLL